MGSYGMGVIIDASPSTSSSSSSSSMAIPNTTSFCISRKAFHTLMIFSIGFVSSWISKDMIIGRQMNTSSSTTVTIFNKEPVTTTTLNEEEEEDDEEIVPSVFKGFPKNFLDGCPTVYLDVGANIGVHGRKAIEPFKYPCVMQAIMNKYLGNKEFRKVPGNVCVVGFELNPVHTERLKKLSQCYTSMNFKFHYFTEVAVANVNDQVVTGNKETNAGDSYWGAKIVDEGEVVDPSKSFKDKTLNLAYFINKYVKNRKLPSNSTSRVLMKMDVEGAEYDVLGGMLAQGALCNSIDAITIEFHDGDNPMERIIRRLTNLPDKTFGCHLPELIEVDDESFLLDGEPKPDECANIDIPLAPKRSKNWKPSEFRSPKGFEDP